MRRAREAETALLEWIESEPLDHWGPELLMAQPIDPAVDLPTESLRRLARALLFERGSADDLVQDAWLAALETRGEIRSLGDWLAGAIRRLGRNRVRAEERRDRRERLAARPEFQPSAADATARVELLRRLIEAVDRLDSPYREAVVLRYFDDLPPRTIAERLGVPVNTARTHVRRGIERLRAELDPGSEREREALLAALVPLLGPGLALPSRPGSESLSSLPKLAMQHPLVLATSVAVLGTLTWLVVPSHAPTAPLGPPSVAAAPLVPADPSQGSPARAPAQAQTKTQTTGRSSTGGRAPMTSGWTVRGHVMGIGGAAYASAPLVGRVFAGGRPEGEPLFQENFSADAQGDFVWSPTVPQGLYTVEIRAGTAAERSKPTSAWFMPGDPAPEDWVLYPFVSDTTVHGTVRDADGNPIAGAWVARTFLDEARSVQTGADGSFTLGCASGTPPRMVVAWKPGFAPGYVEIERPLDASLARTLVLAPPLMLHGTVRGANGEPIAGAKVVVQQQAVPSGAPSIRTDGPMQLITQKGPLLDGAWPQVQTDASGQYAIGVHPQASSVVLSASAAGHGEGKVECATARMPTNAWDFSLPDSAVPAGSVTLTGRVRSAGTPVEAAWITVGDETGEEDAPQAWCDAEGRFTLHVAPGAQHLWVWRRGFAQLRRDVNVEVGLAALELELAPSHFVGGLVRMPDGAPAPWVFVMAEDASGAEPPAFAGFSSFTLVDGTFRLTDLPVAGVEVSVSAPGCEYLTQAIALDHDDAVLQLVAKSEAFAGGGAPGTPTPVVPVTAASGSASLHGRLLDLAGNSRANEIVELAVSPPGEAAAPRRVTTDAHGEFRFTDLPAGTFDARWVRREATLEVIDLETRVTLEDAAPSELELRPTGQATLSGTFEYLTQLPAGTQTAGYGKQPVFGVPPSGMPHLIAVTLEPLSPEGELDTGHRGALAHDGRFEFEGVPAGDWALVATLVHADGKKAQVNQHLKVPASGVSEIRVGVLMVIGMTEVR